MKNFLRKSLFVLIILSTCLFTSCLDYVQTISFSEDGYDCYFKIAVSKAILEIGEEDSQSFFDNFDEMKQDLPKGAEISKIDNDIEVGYEFRILINSFTSQEDMELFNPYLSDDESKIMLPFLLGLNAEVFDTFNSNNPEEQAVMATYMATTKCRFLVSKTVFPQIKGAHFMGITPDLGTIEIPLYDYGSDWCLEIPLIYFTVHHQYDLGKIALDID